MKKVLSLLALAVFALSVNARQVIVYPAGFTVPVSMQVTNLEDFGTETMQLTGTPWVAINPSPLQDVFSGETTLVASLTALTTEFNQYHALGGNPFLEEWINENYTGSNPDQIDSFIAIVSPDQGSPYYGYLIEFTLNDLQSATNVDEGKADHHQIAVYPNPSSGQITIQGFNPGEVIEIHDSLGQLVEQVSINSMQEQLDLSYLPAGKYVIKTTGNGNARKLTIIK
jgi:hypothetical protein